MASGTGWGLRLEGHVVNPLGQVGALPLHLVLRLVDPPAQLAHLFLERLDAGQQLGDEIAAAAAPARWIAASPEIGGSAAPAPARLIRQRLHLPPQVEDLVLQRNAFPAFDLRAGRHRSK